MLGAPTSLSLGETTYVLASDLYSLRTTDGRITDGQVTDGSCTTAEPSEVFFRDDDAGFVVLKMKTAAPRSAGPVYRSEPGGALAVPTGRVFVRFRDDVDVALHGAAVEALGFRWNGPLLWAKNAAWYSAAGQSVAAALRHLSELSRLPNVVSAEPELLRLRQLRG